MGDKRWERSDGKEMKTTVVKKYRKERKPAYGKGIGEDRFERNGRRQVGRIRVDERGNNDWERKGRRYV
jgi:hypothetical protein